VLQVKKCLEGKKTYKNDKGTREFLDPGKGSNLPLQETGGSRLAKNRGGGMARHNVRVAIRGW